MPEMVWGVSIGETVFLGRKPRSVPCLGVCARGSSRAGSACGTPSQEEVEEL